ncbi:MAG: helix-turn-helix domain-containing protein [Clostridiales bacterium]|nr:helix-turn-helix domain-containing protein [Clostridiales bacterium]
MAELTRQVGENIRKYRKQRLMTLEELSSVICKSRSTLSKYEKGEITIDIEVLYEVASALHVNVEQLLPVPRERIKFPESENYPAFFNGISQFYSYIFDGRNNQIIRSVFDVLSATDERRQKIVMYMNFKDYQDYRCCENTYRGNIEHYDAITNISLINQDTPMEKASIQILASYLDADTKWGLWNGFSSRPMMPIAMKMLFSKTPLKEDFNFSKQLKVSREDIRLLKLYNMLSVT